MIDETEAAEIIQFINNESPEAGNVWGDIYRNRYLASARNPPTGLTPENDGDFHPQIKAEELKNSILDKSFHPPEIKGKPSTDEEISALIPLSERGNRDSSWPSDPNSKHFGRSSSFHFDIDAQKEENKSAFLKKARQDMIMEKKGGVQEENVE